MQQIIKEVTKTCDSISWAEFFDLTVEQDCHLEVLEQNLDFLEQEAIHLAIPDALALLKNMPLGLHPDYLSSRITDVVYASRVFPFVEIWNLYPSNDHLDQLKYIALDTDSTPCFFPFADMLMNSANHIPVVFDQLKNHSGNVDFEVEASNLLTVFNLAYTEYDGFDSNLDDALVNMITKFPLVFENYGNGSFHFEESAEKYGMHKFKKLLKSHRSYAPFSIDRKGPIKRNNTWTNYYPLSGARR